MLLEILKLGGCALFARCELIRPRCRRSRDFPSGSRVTVRRNRSCRIPQHVSADVVDRFKLPHNGFDNLFGVIVLPESKHCPAAISQNCVHAAVPVPVGVDLVPPPVRIGFRGRAVSGTAMPETAVQEHDKSTTTPDDVASEFVAGERPTVDPIAIAEGVQFPTNLQLHASPTGFLRLHLPPYKIAWRGEMVRQRCAPSNGWTSLTVGPRDSARLGPVSQRSLNLAAWPRSRT